MTLDQYAEEFDRCAQWIEPALQYASDCYTLDDLRNACLEGKMQLWPGKRSALVSEIAHYPNKTVCIVAFGGGDLEELAVMSRDVMAWAKSVGCDVIQVQGRKGWARALGIGRVVSTTSIQEL